MEALGRFGHARAHGLGQGRGQRGVDFDGADPSAGLQDRKGEGAKSGPDLDDLVARLDAAGPDDPADGSRVVDEILTEDLRRPDAERVGDRLDLDRAEEARVRRHGPFGQLRIETGGGSVLRGSGHE